MTDLVFPSALFESLRAALAHEWFESCALVLAHPVPVPDGRWRLLAREVISAPEEAYEVRSSTFARLRPEFVVAIEGRARRSNLSVAYCHTHPFQGCPTFSEVDDGAEALLGEYLQERLPGRPHPAVVFGREGVTSRIVGEGPCRVVEVGQNLVLHTPEDCAAGEVSAVYDRQVRAFGPEGQRRLQAVRVGVLGAGGTGSFSLLELPYLGVRKFVVLDPDNVDETNLNRLVGATKADIGKPKVEVAERQLRCIAPDAEIEALPLDALERGDWRHLLSSDLIFGCVDGHGARALLNRLAYQYFIPVIDLGTGLDRGAEGTLEISGRVNLLAPGMPCLWCCEELSGDKVRGDLMNERERRQDPYFGKGKGAPQPAVISLNGTVASLAVTMFLSMVTGIPSPYRILGYLGHRGRVAPSQPDRQTDCLYCSDRGIRFGAGDEEPVPQRAPV